MMFTVHRSCKNGAPRFCPPVNISPITGELTSSKILVNAFIPSFKNSFGLKLLVIYLDVPSCIVCPSEPFNISILRLN